MIQVDRYRSDGVETSVAKLVTALKHCATTKNLELGRKLHGQAVAVNSHTNKYVASALINMYGKCGSMSEARKLFEGLTTRNVYAWTCLIHGYVDNGEILTALELFSRMDCKPSSSTFVAAIKGCSKLASQPMLSIEEFIETGKELHKKASEQGMDSHLFVANALVDMYGSFGDMQRAQTVFQKMTSRDVVSWNSLIKGYVANGEYMSALKLFSVMDCEHDYLTVVAALQACRSGAAGSSSKELWLKKLGEIHHQVKLRGLDSLLLVSNTLIDAYSKCKSMQRARCVFESMSVRDVVSWNCLMLGYVENGYSYLALECLADIDTQPDSVTYLGALKACACLASERTSEKQSWLRRGMDIHAELRRRGLESETVLGNVLLDMYCKCGSLSSARGVFERMTNRTVVTWTSLILGYVENGEWSGAVEIFKRMSCQPNSFTYVAVLKACKTLASLELGEQIHGQVCRLGMEQSQLVANALVDLYGKCGEASAAERVFLGMHTTTLASWNALIAGYSSRGESERVFALAREMREVGVELDEITFVCVLAACNHAGMVDEGRRYVELMSECGVKLSVEHCSCIVDMVATGLVNATNLISLQGRIRQRAMSR